MINSSLSFENTSPHVSG
uniref:Uncharacterized protein n=1 Tax=Arundo donax TaxID=35708 RepID=A0A0A9BIG5_ARUDO